jgi:hypothetical protein
MLASGGACVGDTATPSDGGTDATNDGPSTKDSPADAPSDVVADTGPKVCDVSSPFTSSKAVKGMTTNFTISGGTLLSDELTIFYPTTGTNLQIQTATRASTSVDFGALSQVSELDTAGSNGAAWVLGSGTTVYFHSSRANGTTYDLYVATRASVTATWGSPSPVANVNDGTGDDVDPTLNPSGSELLFASNRAGGFRIYRSTINGGTFTAAAEVTELTNVGGGGKLLLTPVLSADGLTLYFGVQGTGIQTWIARRATTNDPFGNLQAVAEITRPCTPRRAGCRPTHAAFT